METLRKEKSYLDIEEEDESDDAKSEPERTSIKEFDRRIVKRYSIQDVIEH